MMKLLKKRSLLVSVAIAMVAILMIFSTAMQIIHSDFSIALPLVSLAVSALIVVIGIRFYPKGNWDRQLQQYPVLIIGIGFILMVALGLVARCFYEHYVPLTPFYVFLAIFIFAGTASAIRSHPFAFAAALSAENAVIGLIIGYTGHYDAIFAITVIGAVIGLGHILHTTMPTGKKIWSAISVPLMLIVSFNAICVILDDSITDFFVERVFFPHYSNYPEFSSLLPQLGIFGGGSPFNALLSGMVEFGPIVWIVALVCTLILLICAILLLRQKGARARHLHLGVISAIAVSFIGNFCFLFDIDVPLTSIASFLNTNSIFLVFDVFLLLLLVKEDYYFDFRDELPTLDTELYFYNEFTVGSRTISLHTRHILGKDDPLISEYALHEAELEVLPIDLRREAEDKSEVTIVSYWGELSNLCKDFRHFSLRADSSCVKLFTGVDSTSDEVISAIKELITYLPPKTGVHVIPGYLESDTCRVNILAF